MTKRNIRRSSSQAVAMALAHAVVFTSMPVYAAPRPVPAAENVETAAKPLPAAPADQAQASAASTVAKPSAPKPPVATPPAPPKVNVNRTVPAVTPPSTTPTFAATPTAAEFLQARIFAEPFLPVGGEPSEAENAALAAAIMTYVQGKDPEDLTAFGVFLNDHPTSAWRASLLTNLGAHYKATGYYTKAAETLQEGWQLAKDKTGRPAAATAERALSELLDLHMQFGKVEALEALMAESEGKDLHGGVTERRTQAKTAIYVLREAHHEAIASAAVSVDQLQGYGKKDHKQHVAVSRHLASHEGASLTDVADLAQGAGLGLRLARRADGDFVPGSIVHLKSGHFTALVRQEGDRFLLADPMLNPSGEVWLTRAALLDESSGYALLPAAVQAPGWQTAARQAVGHIRGKCVAAAPNQGATGPDNTSPNRCCIPGRRCDPMAVYSFHSLLVSLSITDTPVRYSPPRGPWIDFQMTYNQREAFQPTTFTYSNLGPRWNHDWLSYIEDTPSNPLASAKVFTRGGGSEVVTGFVGDRYAPATQTRAIVVRTSASPIRYERQMPDGSIEVFAQSDTGTSPRRVFMTEWKDSAGNTAQLTYDAQLRIVAVTDAIGQVTTLSYGVSSDPLKITKVTDPFGRAATFEYTTAGALVKITDIIGITSEFAYGNGDFIRSLTTPYGTTTFAHGLVGAGYYPMVWLEATDPLGGKERLERVYMPVPGIPATEPANLVPQGFTNNLNLDYRNSVYWDKLAMARHPGDYTKARITRWLWDVNSVMTISDFKHSEKMPLENRVWFGQMGERAADSAGPDGRPAKIGRVLDDGTSQIYRYEYNSKGRKTRETDPVGRETVYEYDNNEIDLLRTKQKNGSNYELLSSATYNAQHLPLTVTDAAGQTTTYTHNSQGQILTIVTPPRDGLTQAERTTTYSYDPNGYLQSVTGPLAGATTGYTYDGYGRVWTITAPDGYRLTYDYDVLDRVTQITYPDATFDQTVYNRLDAEQQRDRLGRWSHTFHDALRRVVSTRDAAGRTTTQQWCNCGSLDKLIDGNNNATTWERDLQGRVMREVRANDSFKEFTYETTTSRLKKIKDAKNQEINYGYFLDDKLQQISYTNAQITTPNVAFTYDAVEGRLATMADGTGTTNYTYHPVAAPPTLGAGRLATVDGPLTGDTISLTYDELARVKTRTLSGITTTWAYDALGRVTTLGDPIGNFIYGYVGSTGRVSSVTYPNAQTTTYAYLPVNQDLRLQEIHHKKPGGATLNKFNRTYDVVGNILTWAQQTDTNPAQTYNYEYDRADQLAAATLAASTPKRYRYAYDPAGNRTAEQIEDVATAAIYDNMNRLTTQAPGGAMLFRGTTDEPAAVTVQTTPAAITPSNEFSAPTPVSTPQTDVVVQATDYASPTPNVRTNTYRVTQSGATKSFTNDPNGNLTSDGVKTYFWDAADRLVEVKQGTTTLATFTYDGEGRRATKTAGGVTTSYVYEGPQFLEERPSVGSAKRYVYGLGIDQPLAQIVAGTATYNLADHLGSIVRTTDTAGNPTLTREYDPWGNPLQGAGTSGYAFTGREWDAETGLHYYRARYYDPKIGRFISEDPLISIHELAGSREILDITEYTYAGNNPIGRVDPYGLSFWETLWHWSHWVHGAVGLGCLPAFESCQRFVSKLCQTCSSPTTCGAALRKTCLDNYICCATHACDEKPWPYKTPCDRTK